ncbi:MAG: hypothetical protein U0X91_20240 [Spirosomataceae bacterium]
MEEVIKKFKFRDKGTVLNAPADMKEAFAQFGFQTDLDKNGLSKNTLVFVYQREALQHFLNNELKYIEPDSVLWLAYPKGSSKVMTDINRDSFRQTGETFGITTVTAVSINDTWSALRFRPIDSVGK